MSAPQAVKWFRRVIRWSLLIMILLYLITGFGITEFRTVESLTFGLVDKVRAFQIHTRMEIPFITLLALHVLFPPTLRIYGKLKMRRDRGKIPEYDQPRGD